GLEIAARLRALEHVEIDPVLEAAARTVPFELEVDRRYHVGRHAAELDEGRAPDGLADGMERATVGIPEDRHGSRIVPASVAAVQAEHHMRGAHEAEREPEQHEHERNVGQGQRVDRVYRPYNGCKQR